MSPGNIDPTWTDWVREFDFDDVAEEHPIWTCMVICNHRHLESHGRPVYCPASVPQDALERLSASLLEEFMDVTRRGVALSMASFGCRHEIPKLEAPQ